MSHAPVDGFPEEVPSRGRIDRRSAVPLYHQLRNLIAAEITHRGLAPGDRIPGEFELCERYAVSRTVVRQSLDQLEREGVVTKERGRGTFVADRRSSRGIGHALVGTFEDIQTGHGDQRTRILGKRVVPATSAVSGDLQLGDDAEVVEITRLRLIDGLPWALTVTQFPVDVGRPLLTDDDLEDASLFAVLESRYGVRFERARRSVEAGTAPDEVAQRLGVAESDPMLVIRSVSVDGAGRPVERFTGWHRGDLARLDVQVER